MSDFESRATIYKKTKEERFFFTPISIKTNRRIVNARTSELHLETACELFRVLPREHLHDIEAPTSRPFSDFDDEET